MLSWFPRCDPKPALFHPVHVRACCVQFRPWYPPAATPSYKDVVIVIDVSGSMGTSAGSTTRMALAIQAANTVLATLNPNDRVGVIAFSSGVSVPFGCYSTALAAAIPANIASLQSFVNSLLPNGGTMYAGALSAALAMLRNAPGTANRTQVVLFATDGEPNDSTSSIMNAIATYNSNKSIRIFTFGIAIAASTILQQIADQNNGVFVPLPNVADVRTQLGSYYVALSVNNPAQRPIWTVPYFDASGLGVVTTITLPVYHNGHLMGVAGIDTVLSDLLGSLGRYSLGLSYAFVIDGTGRVLVHPMLPELLNVVDPPQFVNITTLEVEPEFAAALPGMLAGQSGAITYNKTFVRSRGNSLLYGVATVVESTTLYYRPVAGTEFSVALVLASSYTASLIAVTASVPQPSTAPIYHELDVMGKEQCHSYGTPVTTLASTYKFAPSAFSDPTQFVNGGFSKAQLTALEQAVTGTLALYQERVCPWSSVPPG